MRDLTYQDVLAILRLIDTGSFATLEVEFEGTSIKVVRRDGGSAPATGGAVLQERAPSPAAAAATAVVHRAAPAPEPARPAPERMEDIPQGVAVKPPMEGTFYAAAAPGAPPFAEVGKRVAKGDQLGTVEVMKLFTPVAAPCAGTIRSILVRNEQVVSKDQTLMLIEADR